MILAEFLLFLAGTTLTACTLPAGGERINFAPRTGTRPLSTGGFREKKVILMDVGGNRLFRELESRLQQWQENGRRGTPVPDIVGIIR